MARIKAKPEIPVLKNWDEVDLSLAEMAEHKRAINAVTDAENAALDEIKLDAQIKREPHKTRKDELFKQIHAFVEANRADLGTKKTRELVFGKVGYRKSTKLQVPSDPTQKAAVIERLRAIGWLDCLKITPITVNKEALHSKPLGEVAELGVGVKIEDTFWLEVKREDPPAEV
ncbi:MAG: host-nuclease inhibitor Gam family protein [Clostridiales bacterium]|nr:host-nuclease inhibitor Gam family protein [Clostridiales bacterium]